jgi:soluble lytic murein transglycosylase
MTHRVPLYQRSGLVMSLPFCRAGAVLCAALVMSLTPLSGAAYAASIGPNTAQGDAAFADARTAFERRDSARLAYSLDRLNDHPLKPWADYWLVRMRLDAGLMDEVPGFMQRYPGSYLADRLRGDWVRVLGERGDWEGVRREALGLIEIDRPQRCHIARATANDVPMRALLAEGKSLPDACIDTIVVFLQNNLLNDEDVWRFVRRLGEKKLNNDMARMASLVVGERVERKAMSQALDLMAKNPGRYLERLPASFSVATTRRSERELALAAVQRYAQHDPELAADTFARLASRFTANESAAAWGYIGLLGAWKHLPQTQDWFARVSDDTALSEEQMTWRVRAALRAQDWRGVESAIAAMPPALAEKPDWTYWQGRAYAALGRPAEARLRYERIAGQPSFYSNLADEELGRLVTVPPRARPGAADHESAAAMAGVQRALALIRLDQRNEGLREWNFALRNLSDKQLLAVAEIARADELWDRAIHAANKTQREHDYSLRFLAPYRDQVQQKSAALNLDHGWVYGLMRQESRFITRAKSNVGAQGLMQVMPATAKWVANKISLPGYTPQKIAELDTNVTLGTNYLKIVLDSLDNHPVLASAAYNAGPGRARRWRADVPLEGAIYAETIPFSETRDYVKNVMSNAAYYRALFDNKPQSLKAMMGTVRPQGSGERGVDALP